MSSVLEKWIGREQCLPTKKARYEIYSCSGWGDRTTNVGEFELGYEDLDLPSLRGT